MITRNITAVVEMVQGVCVPMCRVPPSPSVPPTPCDLASTSPARPRCQSAASTAPDTLQTCSTAAHTADMAVNVFNTSVTNENLSRSGLNRYLNSVQSTLTLTSLLQTRDAGLGEHQPPVPAGQGGGARHRGGLLSDDGHALPRYYGHFQY